MPFGLPSLPGRAHKDDHKQEASLDDILPHTNQRIDLILTVAICADHMKDSLTAAFESQAEHKTTADTPESHEGLVGIQKEQGSNVSMASKESLSSSMKHLESAGVAHFNAWRSLILNKMGSAMDVKVETVKDAYARHKSTEHGAAVNPQDNNRDPKGPIESTSDSEITHLPFPKVELPDSLQPLDEKHRALLVGAVLFMLLSLENYSAHSRVLMTYLCQNLDLPHDVLSSVETTTAATLLDAAAKSSSKIDAEEARKKEADEGSFGRKWKVGLASVAGAAVIGITGGLAAPLVIGLAGTIMGGIGLGGLATLLGATILNPLTIGALFGAFGGKMTGNAMKAYSKEVEDFSFLPISEMKPEQPVVQQSGSSQTAEAPPHKLRVGHWR